MSDWLSWLFNSQGYMPHGHCYLWQPSTLWLNAGSDGVIAAAYFVIPISLYSLVKRRTEDLPFPGLFLMFAAFILLCGSTHTMEIWTIWNPNYRLAGLIKLLTAIVSITTAFALFRLMPLALQLRSPSQLKAEVQARTAQLALANERLQRTVAELQRQREEIQFTHRQRNESLALLATTLRSVGDAVMSTDATGSIQFMNVVAEVLTGWSEAEARGRPVDEVFHIVNEHTRRIVESPVAQVLRERKMVGLANHTVLITRNGAERPIEDSGAPIVDEGELKGVVLVFRDATAPRAAKRALAESEMRFRAAVEAVQGVLWTTTADGQMSGEQPRWAALTGQRAEEYRGMGWLRAVHPDDVDATVATWTAAVRDHHLFAFEHRLRRYDGRWRSFSVRAIPIMGADNRVQEWVGVHTDITEQRENEQALRRSEARFVALANAMPQLVWVEGTDGTHEYFNRGWYEYTGLPDNVPAHEDTWARVLHPEDAQRVTARWNHSQSTGDLYEIEFRLRRFDGVFRWFLARAVADRDASGAIVQWYGTCTDIENAKRVEQSLRQTEIALREADRRKDVFLAILSHELRNPLAPIRNAAALLERPNLDPELFNRCRDIIARQVRHMASLLDDLLDVSRITRGMFALKKEKGDLRTLLSEAAESARPLIDRKHHVLRCAWPGEPVVIEADPVRIVQIITNLLTNAAKYMDPGGEIDFRVVVESNVLVISVKDFGVGIPPDMLTAVFDMFSQVEAHQPRAEGGLGIGLALVKGLVELHGGQIEARSEGVNCGSEFVVSLPCVSSDGFGDGEPGNQRNDDSPE